MEPEISVGQIGTFVHDEDDEWLTGQREFTVAPLRANGRFIIDDPESDLDRAAAAAERFLALDAAALDAATPHVWRYYEDAVRLQLTDLKLGEPAEVWDHVRVGDEFHVVIEDDVAYVDLECECAWDIEHGLQLVFRDGDEIRRVGGYEGSGDYEQSPEIYAGS